MTSALQANSDSAQATAASLLEFQPHVGHPAASEVAALASELYSTSSVLLEFRAALTDPRHARRHGLVEEDKYVVLKSLEFTFRDVKRLLAGVSAAGVTTAAAASLGVRIVNRDQYRSVWQQIDAHFRSESNNSLQTRISYYKRFLKDCTRLVVGQAPSSEIESLFDKIDGLLKIQEDRMAQDLENLSLGTSRQRSWERVRPFSVHGRKQPNVSPPISPLPGNIGRGNRRQSYTSPISPFARHDDYGFPPAAPDVPSSPSIAAATTSTTQSSSSGSMPVPTEHWLPAVFGQSRPTTVFRTTGRQSSFHGEHQHQIQARIEAQYDRLESFPFDNGLVEMRFYLRSEDRRARLLCKTERGGRRYQASLPCTMLRVTREDSCLQLCQVDERKRWMLWTSLRFPSYERMVLFHCGFLALKAQDEAHPIKELQDHVLEGEVPLFSAIIIDDNYEHTLMILKDEDSGGIRLQASAARGPLKRCPIWTAFINYHVALPRRTATPWVRLAEQRKVHLGDLNRYVFTFEYTPHYGPNGEHELCFDKSSDAKDFFETIHDLADGRA